MKKLITHSILVLCMLFNAISSQAEITVRLDPSSVPSWSSVYLYAWTGSSTPVLGSWPGRQVIPDSEGWYSYTFHEDITSVNIIWNYGSAQTKDITNVTQSTCYSLNSQTGNKIEVTIVDCLGDVIIPEDTIPEDIILPQLPRAELWYDFTGTGEKGIVQEGWCKSDIDKNEWQKMEFEYIAYTHGMSKNFEAIDSIMAFEYNFKSKLAGYLYAIEDINGDGKMDFSHESNRNLDYWATISDAGEYNDTQEGKLINTNFDVNNDGRIDYLLFNGVEDNWSIMFQQADGSFEEQYMQLMSTEEYASTFDPNDSKRWGSTASNGYRGRTNRGVPNALAANLTFSGVWLGPPEVYYDDAFMPTRTLDLNADGYMDIIDEERGIFCYNGGDGKWVRVDMSCSGIIVADLNGDDIQDFVYPGSKLCAVIYRGENNFETQVLYENLQVDQDMYCYDFDRDGDVDILVTFSAPLNSTGYAYTMFFENDGDGRFTQLEEQDYGANKLLFSNCQDLDGDGYYDMLAFRGQFETNNYREVKCSAKEKLEVVWLKGLSNKTFANPELLITYSPDEAEGKEFFSGEWFLNHNKVKINAADIDNDGYIEVWVSEEKDAVTIEGFSSASQLFTKLVNMSGVINTAPSAPDKPELRYDNGLLTISWGNGTDAQTSTTDLTYALRVGSTPGGNDILHAHANADGSRRNFLDGNMGKYHTYTLDLTQRKPCMVYVSVQAIDAQYVGSAWSEEASVEHTALFADFSVSKNEVGRGVVLTATALDLGEEATHSWIAEDGVCVGSGNVVQISFDAVGKKSITHTITLTDGTMAIANEIVNVMPNHVDTADFSGIIESSMMNMYVDVIRSSAPNRLLADYNMDGYWDAIGVSVFVEGATSSQNAIFKGAEDYAFSRASGIWNTDLEFNSTFWYDWDHNGAADVLVETSFRASEAEYYYLPHNGTSNMQAKKSDENLAALFGSYLYSDLGDFGGYMQYVDFTHNGYYDFYAGSGKDTSSYFYTHRLDGSYQKEEIKGDVDKWLLQAALTGGRTVSSIGIECGERFYIDVNKDGFTDACVLYYDYINRGPYTDLVVMLNKGNCQFEQLIIPFAQSLSSPRSAGGSDIYNPHLADMNNDGYIDIVANRGYDGAVYIMWNEANQRFSAPDILPLGDLDDFLFEDKFKFGYSSYIITAQIDVVDIDNNGYLDVVSMQHDKSIGYSFEGNKGYGPYVHYFGPDGVIRQGFLYKHTDLDVDVILDQYNLFKLPNHEWSVLLTGFNYGGLKILPIHGTTNERPSAPEGVRAVQNAEGMLIEWSGAKDDFTPAVQMRYNLSVKKKGQTGAGAYIISPQNGANSNAAPVRNYDYITATQYLVPLTVLSEGEYEIQVQEIDLQGDWSDFSEPITIEIQRESVLEAPTVACLKKPITLVYMGAPSTSTPEWNFDGAEVVSGSGYGPYELKWDSVGTKTISLTVDGETKTRMIYVEENDFKVNFPSVVVDKMPVTINLPKGMEATYYIGDEEGNWVLISNFRNIVTQKGNTLTFIAYPNSAEQGIYLGIQLENENGCDTILKKAVYVVGQDDVPTISLVTSNADGHNVINWSETSTYNFSEVRVLKETNRYNQFVEVGIVPIYEGMYVDRSSNAAVKSERYVIEPVMGDVEIPMGTIHQTTHLTINRGLNDQTWNLIWNRYEGANVVSYNILRGASPDAMTTIATVSSNHTSYTDFALDSSEPYYAIEYVLAGDVNMAPQQRRNAARNLNSGRSNVVNSATAGKIVYAEKIAVLSANNKYETTAEKDVLLLYAELMPVATTYQQVKWEIISGSDLATIDQNGLLTARTPNNGGVVTVKATTADGTNLSATRNITIGAIVVEENPEPNPEDKVYYTVTFQDWDGTILKTEQVEQGQSATAPTNPTREGYTFIGWDTEFSNVQSDLLVKALYVENGSDLVYFIVGFMDWDGTILKTEQVLQGQSATPPADPVREGYTFIGWDTDFSNVQSDLLVRALYEQNTALEDIEEDATLRPRKEMIDGILYIIMPDGTKYTMQGKRVK
ncbi:MAG: VCBS repeat-containing protein [Paludibacteraceae bacterium]|nr:VCBS repeat-containing protein [Paludibacteraceae bacterium]